MKSVEQQGLERAEYIASGRCDPSPEIVPGVELRSFVSEACGARGFSTGTASLEPGVELPYYTCEFSEAFTVLRGSARLSVEGRSYSLSALDSAHIPAGVAHSVRNERSDGQLVAHLAFASARPDRNFGAEQFDERPLAEPAAGAPETIRRFDKCEVYELSPGAFFSDLFARRFGSAGICGGYGRFEPGSSLPCHIHDFDESITIVTGDAVCLVQGRRYQLNGYDTAFVPKGRPHRFLNQTEETMAMVWVYAGDEPDRRIVDSGYCSGALGWPPG